MRVIAVNDCYLLAPWAEVLYFADAKWWRWQRERAEFRAFAGQKCTIFATGNQIDDAKIHILRNAGPEGLSADPGALATGSTSGYQAVNIAVLAGPARVVLLGYDGRQGADGRRHWFGDHPDRTEPPYQNMIQRFRTMIGPLKALGVEILNATPGSAIDAFPRVDAASVLPDP